MNGECPFNLLQKKSSLSWRDKQSDPNQPTAVTNAAKVLQKAVPPAKQEHQQQLPGFFQQQPFWNGFRKHQVSKNAFLGKNVTR